MEMEKQAWVVGVQVRIKTLPLGEIIEGEIFSYDANTNCVVLLTKSGDSTHTCRILKTQYVKEVAVLSAPSHEADLTLPPINTQVIRAREQLAIRRAQQDATRLGVGVTQEAQDIFNSLCKTLPCRWHGDTMIVFEDIRIVSPYSLSDVAGSDHAAVNRVKKVLEGERRKLGMAN